MNANKPILSFTVVSALLFGSISFGLAQTSNSQSALGQQLQEKGSTPGTPGASGDTSGANSSGDRDKQTEELRGGMPPMHNNNKMDDDDGDDD